MDLGHDSCFAAGSCVFGLMSLIIAIMLTIFSEKCRNLFRHTSFLINGIISFNRTTFSFSSPKFLKNYFSMYVSNFGVEIALSLVQISDQLKSRFSSGLSLPQICENFVKAAYDPRISGIYLQIEALNCGWGKVEELRRHILNFKKSGTRLF